MASVPSNPGPVLGRVDRDGRLIAADPYLERLQREAGSAIGAPLALPQLASVVRITQRLRIPVSRRVLAAGKDQDIDMWVRAVPDGDDIALAIEQWTARPASPPRLGRVLASDEAGLSAAPLVWSIDEQLRFVSLSPSLAEMLSLEPEAAAGQQLTNAFRLEENESGALPLVEALATRSSFSGQPVTARSGGTRLLLSGEVSVGAGGRFAGFEGTATPLDATVEPPRPVVDREIHTALRSPLDSIVRTAQDMIERSAGAGRDEYAAYAGDIATAARHLLSVVRSLGEKAEAPGRYRVDLVELILEAVALVETAAHERQIAIGVQPGAPLLARGESRSVIQILVNLIGNAVRYSPPGTAVTVSFAEEGGSVFAHVADEGPGIDPADQERIFEPFQQGGDGGEGSGLGLSISRRLARSMGGDIQLHSAPGEGARFTLVLPSA